MGRGPEREDFTGDNVLSELMFAAAGRHLAAGWRLYPTIRQSRNSHQTIESK